MRIEATLHWNEALRLDYSYRIHGPDDRSVAKGYTVQLLTDLAGNLLLSPPDWLQEFKGQWQQGLLA